ncbi:MAG: SagB family peptide dehydrogenase [Armatimonadota bacterium]|nr:SagB family peptide dehydrogenase [Armatimonadota bacterium]MDR7440191.1 SagB family peptide dehydrogenase [Armatimonadota bacterium]MDR7562588.1 SagB family peptide dehydrogenase [Armatimonadota bacterium]MDR7568644.1 SagB family peptide dehydrogenase [Armatimonadota bacterium]MDR7602871.1 SagB family peptide dehydrogenase [Armatimonadota bacterium]
MRNGATEMLAYHEATKHSYWSVRRSPGWLDWSNEPRLVKVYRGLEPLPLPPDPPKSSLPAVEAVALPGTGGDRILDPRTLAGFLRYSAGILRARRYPGGEIRFRAAPCTGALYHIEVYPVCADLPGLPAGVYHYGPQDHALRRLREGDHRAFLARAAGEEGGVERCAAVLVLTSVWQRNAWKYRARAYRHVFWDAGTLLANLLAVAAAHGIPARVVAGFVDQEVTRLLDLDPDRELPVALVALGSAGPPSPPPPVAPLGYAVEPVLPRELRESLILSAHAASAFGTPEEVRAWRGIRVDVRPGEPSGILYPLRRMPPDRLPGVPVEEVIRRRRSTRRFARTPIPFEAFSEVLLRATGPIPADFLPDGASLVTPFLLVHAVEGLPPGAYLFRPDLQALEPLRPGEFRGEAAYLALEQPAAGEAAVAVFWMARLPWVLDALGARGYRAVQLEGGIRGGKIYLLAHALGLRATALTFYDDEITNFFLPAASGYSPMFLVVFGRRRRSPDTF